MIINRAVSAALLNYSLQFSFENNIPSISCVSCISWLYSSYPMTITPQITTHELFFHISSSDYLPQ